MMWPNRVPRTTPLVIVLLGAVWWSEPAWAADARASAAGLGTGWRQLVELLPLPEGDERIEWFGAALAASGDTLAVGGYQASTSGVRTAIVHVFVRNGSTWSQQARILAPHPSPENDVRTWLALSGDTLLVGNRHSAPGGEAHVYVRSGGNWALEAVLASPDGAAGGGFGWSSTRRSCSPAT